MTDDTDHAEREDDGRAVSLPLLDTFAALEAELTAKEERIERLENELAQEFLDPNGGQQTAVGATADNADAGHDSPTDSGVNADVETEPRSHEDWEPETDPLSDTSDAGTDAEHEEGPPSIETTANEATASEGTATEPPESVDDTGLKPVRTASTKEQETAESDVPSTDVPTTDEGFGLPIETSADLTGGSLGSSTDEKFVAATDDESTGDDAESDSAEAEVGASRPDPTSDRGERLSLLVRREELRDEAEVVQAFVRGIQSLDDVTRGMLAYYREAGDAEPVDAHVAAGGSGERQYAYARNRTLRKAGVVEHDGAGRYRYALPDLVEEAFDGRADGQTLANAVDAIESATGIDE